MTRLADMTEDQLERKVAKANRRARRQLLQKRLESHLHRTSWGYRTTFGSLRAGAKLLAARIVASKLRNSTGGP